MDLLSDLQIRVTPKGEESYYNIIYSIETAKGLDDGAIQISWDPGLETLVLHHIRLIRDGRPIDLLGDGSKIPIMRREKNFEKAAIDGRLTVALQPDDLRVGDIIDMAYTRTRLDPAMGGHSNFFLGPNDGNSYGRNRIRVLWPTERKMKWLAFAGVVQPKTRQLGSETELSSDLLDVTTKEPPQSAPSRFRSINLVEVTDFPDWNSVSKTIEPLYAKAATLTPDSPLRSEVARIAAATRDPRARAEMALALVQEKVRYLLIELNGGGYRPAAADLTWSRRYGDCKAKTVLLIALLRELGIAARPVLVSTTTGDSLQTMLPTMSAFDHVLVQAKIGGRDYWLDGTRSGDRSLAQSRTPDYHFGLPIEPGPVQLVTMTPEPLTLPTELVELDLDARAGIEVPAPVHARMLFRGDSAIDKRLQYSGLSDQDREDALKALWRKNYDFITPQKVSTVDDPLTGEFALVMDGVAKMDWSKEAGTRWYEVDGARIGWKFDIVREGQLNADAPFAIDFPDWWAKRETIRLPAAGAAYRLQGGDVDEKVGGVYAFHRSIKLKDDVLTMEADTKALAAELPEAKASATRARMAELASVGVFVRLPEEYTATAGDLQALSGDKSALTQALLVRGARRFDKGETAGSLSDVNSVLALDDSVATAHAIRAMILTQKGDPGSDADADRALALDPKSWLALNAKGVTALRDRRFKAAEEFLVRSIAIQPGLAGSYVGRGTARVELGRNAEALADFDKALELEKTLDLRGLRSVALAGLGRNDEAVTDINAAMAKNPKDVEVRALRARIMLATDHLDEARSDLDQLIAAKPDVELYLLRARTSPNTPQATRDLDSAVKLNPNSIEALATRSSLATTAGDLAQAEGDIAAIEKLEPGNRVATTLRMQVFSKRGKGAEAVRLADALVTKYQDATAYNERCWMKATMNVSLETALADCDKALQLKPNLAAALDSRAFVELRQGALDRAIADYDAALKQSPTMAASLFGRAIARARKGAKAEAIADLAAARKADDRIEQRFAEYGVTVPPDLAP